MAAAIIFVLDGVGATRHLKVTEACLGAMSQYFAEKD
jgi:hypothetical protein